jgi:hypothetical protein
MINAKYHFYHGSYSRLTNTEQGKDIEKRLYSIFPETLNIELITINNNLVLIMC